jgi:hypothetical protein
MIDPIKCAERLIENDPSGLAGDLLDLMIWVNRPNLEDDGDYNEILNNLYVKLESTQRSRDEYVKRRAA